jgi:hypothetical protein
MNAWFRKLSWLARRRRKEEDLRAELEFHLSEESERRKEDGLADDEAPRAARRELGNVTRVGEDTRTAWGWTLLEQFSQDVRYAVRTMAANRLFTLTGCFIVSPGNRGEHGYLQLHGCHPDALAAGNRSRVAGGYELARQALGKLARLCYAWRQRQYL